MNKFKKILISLLSIHVVFMFSIGVSSFGIFKKDDKIYNKLNSLGKLIVQYANNFKFSESINDFINFYSIYTGTNRGYSFFSPNVSLSNLKMTFIANGKEIKLPLITHESKLKFSTANLNFSLDIIDTEKRDLILKSMSSYLFSVRPDIDKIDIYLNRDLYLNLNETRKIGYMQKKDKVLGFSALRNNKNAMLVKN